MWDFRPVVPGSFRAPARKVMRVFLHCTDSDAPHLVGTLLAEEVNRWHLANGWAGIGYHFIVDKVGTVVSGRPLELTPSAQLGADGLGNVAAIAISTHGSKRWTVEGLTATRNLCREIDAAYVAAVQPVTFWGHTEIDPRPCPVYAWRALLGLDSTRRFGVMPLIDPAILATEASGAAPPRLAIVDPGETHLLVEGCHSGEVRALQRALGFTGAAVDGWFGRQTRTAVQAFQGAHGLAPDGVVGPATRTALGVAS